MAMLMSNIDGLPSGYRSTDRSQTTQTQTRMLPLIPIQSSLAIGASILTDSRLTTPSSTQISPREVTSVNSTELAASARSSAPEAEAPKSKLTEKPLVRVKLAICPHGFVELKITDYLTTRVYQHSDAGHQEGHPPPKAVPVILPAAEAPKPAVPADLPSVVEETQNLTKEILGNPALAEIEHVTRAISPEQFARIVQPRLATPASTPSIEKAESAHARVMTVPAAAGTAHTPPVKAEQSFLQKHWKTMALVALVALLVGIAAFAVCSAAGVGELQYMGNFHEIRVNHLVSITIGTAYTFTGLGYLGMRCLEGSES